MKETKTPFLFLLLKITVTTGVLYFLYYKYREFTKTHELSFKFWTQIPKENIALFALACILVFFNWGIEIYKWHTLKGVVIKSNLKSAVSDVLRGISLSVFTPNRNGEFIGRLWSLPRALKIKGFELYLVGSLSQQFYTVLYGFVSLSFAGLNFKFWAAVLLCFLAFILLNINSLFKMLNRISFIQNSLNALQSINRLVLQKILLFSGIRYLVFFLQYLLLFKAFNVNLSLTQFGIVIPSIFFIGSYVPNFALVEMGVKSVIALYCIKPFSNNELGIIMASFAIWFINVGIPALIGIVPFIFAKAEKTDD